MVRLMQAPWMKERALKGGRETLNMAEGQIHYINNVAHSIAKRESRGQQQLYLNDPKMRAQPELQALARKYFAEISYPTEKGYSGIKALVFFNYCMFSPLLAYVELTQQLTNHIPALASAGMGVGDAFRGVKQANVDFFKALQKGHAEKAGRNVYDSPEETEVVERAKTQGIIDTSWLQEFFHLEDDVPFLNARNMVSGKGVCLIERVLVGSPLYHLYKLGVKAHAIAINLNTETAFLSAYWFYRKNHTKDEAFKLADDLSHEFMHGGGRASRPFWYLGIGPGTPRPTVGGLMYSLQMYVYNTIGQHARYLKNAIGNSKLTPAETTAARKAAACALTAQVALAGMMGLPFSSQIFALIEQMFPGSEPKRKMREMFYGKGEWLNSKTHLFGQDKEMGSFIADAAMDGISNSIPGGINMSNRFELGGLMGVSPYGGFDWKNMLGPAGDMLSRLLVKVPTDLSSGDVWGAARDAIPNNQVRRIAQLASDGWNIRNKDQRLNVELSDSEKVLMAAGFTPKRVHRL